MTEQVEEVVEDAEALANLESGFSDTPTVDTPPATDAQETGDTKPEETTAEEKKEEKKEEQPEYVQLTKAELERLQAQSTLIEQLRADYGKKIDTAFGKVGGLERVLNELKSATPAGYTVDVTDDIVEELKKEFPELGDLTLAALKKFASKLKGTAPAAAFDSSQLEALVQSRVLAERQQTAREILAIKHENWEEIIGLPDPTTGKPPETEYRKWLAQQPKEYQESVGSSWNARVIAASIDKFVKDTEAAKLAASKAEEAKKAQPGKTTPTRQQRLAAAVTPKGAGGNNTPPAKDDFLAGYEEG